MSEVTHVTKEFLMSGETELEGYIYFHGLSKGLFMHMITTITDYNIEAAIAVELFQTNNYNLVDDPANRVFIGNVLKFGASIDEYQNEVLTYTESIKEDEEVDINSESFPNWYRLPLLVHGSIFVDFVNMIKTAYGMSIVNNDMHLPELKVLNEIMDEILESAGDE